SWLPSQVTRIEFDFLRNLDGENMPENPVNSCEILLPPGQQLTIGPGMEIIFKNGFSMTVQGSLQAQGTRERPISIHPGQGIRFTRDALPSLLTWCDLTNGTGTVGGAVYVEGFSGLIVDNCNFYGNKAVSGGALYLKDKADITIRNSRFNNNSAGRFGGGIFCADSSPVIENCVINSNSAASPEASTGEQDTPSSSGDSPSGSAEGDASPPSMPSSMYGGGIYIREGSPVIKESVICDNSAPYGGGIHMESSRGSMINTILCNNLSTVAGGGLHLKKSMPVIANSTIINNLTHHGGGGIYMDGSSPVVINSIVYNNYLSRGEGGALSSSQIHLTFDSAPEISYSNIMDGTDLVSGTGTPSIYTQNMDADPMFVSTFSMAGPGGTGTGGDWSLKPDSPCINRGTREGRFTSIDIKGVERPFNGAMEGIYAYDEIAVDMGAHEFPNNPPFIGDDGRNLVLPLAYATEGRPVTLKLAGGFDVDGDAVNLLHVETPPDILRQDGEISQGGTSSPYLSSQGGTSSPYLSSQGGTSSPYLSSQGGTSSPSLPRGSLHQYVDPGKDSGNSGSHAPASGEEINLRGAVTDPLYRVNYMPPEIRESFTDTLFFRLFDGVSLSPNHIMVNIYVTAVDNIVKEPPTGIQENRLNQLGQVDGNSASADPETVVAAIVEVAGTAMTPFQKSSFLNGVRQVSGLPLAPSQRLSLLEGLDAFCTNNPDSSDVLSEKEAAQVLFALEQMVKNGGMTVDGILKTARIMDDLILQQGGLDRLPSTLSDTMESLARLLVSRAESVGMDIYHHEVGGSGFQALIHSMLDSVPPGGDDFIERLSQRSRMDITPEQVTGIIRDIQALLQESQLTREQYGEITAVLDTLISRNQLGTLALTKEQINQIQSAVQTQVLKAAFLFDRFYVESYSNIRYWIDALDFTKRPGYLFVGQSNLNAPGIMVPDGAMAELAGNFGAGYIRLCLIYQSVTTGVESALVSAFFIDGDSVPVAVKGLENPLGITIPITHEKGVVPKWHDKSRGSWSTEGISGVDDSVNGIISFDVNHLTDFALFPNSDPATDSGEESDRTDSNLGSSGCFIGTVIR
ncbi:MAG: right-handed parallel beta-helix repeat-containing protein, partial [Desulfamplus sp.]|nr:right-handed parallel beta-helix repeat-containing protein [Desulfamplus sp.]